MFEFIENHHNLIFNTLPAFFHNKWVIMFINLVFFYLLVRLCNFVIDKFANKIIEKKDDFEYKKQLITLKSIIKSVVDTIIAIFAIMFILNALGIDIRPILTAAGVLGVAVGFGAKRFFEDIITGLSLILEGQIRVGDYIEVSGHEGVVEKIDIKLLKLRDLRGRVHYIRNGMVDTVINYTREFSYYLCDLGISYNEDVAKVIDVLKEIDNDFRQNSELKDEVIAPMEIFGLDKFDDSAVIIKFRVRTKPMKQWVVGRAYNQAIKKKFDEQGIEFPFPQTTVHFIDETANNNEGDKAN